MSELIPIAKPMRKPRQCQQCGDCTGCVYVKVKDQGFRRVCVPCAHKMCREIKEKYPKPMPTEDQKQKYFEEGYDQCFREVIEEIKTWNHPDTKSFIMWLSKTFKMSAAKL